jgi:enoyl-CoA hydratase/carnithine racemase
MTSPGVRVESDGEIAHIVLDRPDRSNALDAATACAVAEAIEQTAADARVAILTGEGKAFCAGGDLDELEAWSEASEEEVREHLYTCFQAMIRAIRSSSAVVIAAINGAAVGAGCDLALACDLRVAARGAVLGQVWVRLGVIPGTGGAWFTQALAGPTAAAELLLTGKPVSADRAYELGLVNAVVEPGALLDEARALAESILEHPRGGVIANKRALVAASEPGLEAALQHAAQVQPSRFTSEEFRLAVQKARS